METSLRVLKVLWGALLASIVAYVVIGEKISRSRPVVDPLIFRVLAAVAILDVVMMFLLRRTLLAPSLQILAHDPNNSMALMRWRGASIATLALCEAVGLFGFVLRVVGFGVSQVAPFYIGGLLLMVFLGPRRPVSNEVGASASTAR